MASYYGFKEKTTEELKNSQIQWGDISKEISDGINKESKRRTELKAEIEKDYRTTFQGLDTKEIGESTEGNVWITKQSQNHRQYLMGMNKMMKSGIISPDEFKLRQTALSATWKRVNSDMKNFQTLYKKAMDSGNEGSSYLALRQSKFFNLKNVEVHIAPKTGTGRYGVKNLETGEVDFLSTGVLGNPESYNFEDFNMAKELKDRASQIDTFTKIIRKKGIESVESAKKFEDFSTWFNNSVPAIMGGAQKTAQLLINEGVNYGYTGDKNKAGKTEGGIELIYVPEGSSEPQLTDKQKQGAKKIVETALNAKLGWKEVGQQMSPLSASAASANARKKVLKEAVAFSHALTGSDQEAANRVGKQIAANREDIKNVFSEGTEKDRVWIVEKIVKGEVKPVRISGIYKEDGSYDQRATMLSVLNIIVKNTDLGEGEEAVKNWELGLEESFKYDKAPGFESLKPLKPFVSAKVAKGLVGGTEALNLQTINQWIFENEENGEISEGWTVKVVNRGGSMNDYIVIYDENKKEVTRFKEEDSAVEKERALSNIKLNVEHQVPPKGLDPKVNLKAEEQ